MKLVVLHKHKGDVGDNNGLLRFAFSSEPIATLAFEGLCGSSSFESLKNVVVAAPAEWGLRPHKDCPEVIGYEGNEVVCFEDIYNDGKSRWFTISHGGFAISVDWRWLWGVLESIGSDVIGVNMNHSLAAYVEKARITTDSNIVGFRRMYSDSVQPAQISHDWPHHVFIRKDVLAKVLVHDAITLDWQQFVSRCHANSLKVNCFDVAGTVLDLNKESGLLRFLADVLNLQKGLDSHEHVIADGTRFFGKIAIGKNVHIGEKALVMGPAVLADDARIGDGAVVRTSIIGPGVSIPQDGFVQNRVLPKDGGYGNQDERCEGLNRTKLTYLGSNYFDLHNGKSFFRKWSRFSYAALFKRICDFVGATIVLLLFVPIFPIIALAIKLTSPGPVFYKARRQGLHGREFDCLKFRSMTAGADEIQERLRVVSEVDGPQFKMQDDPRVNAVGRFLRDTYLDEIPQFINVLKGEMSIVGPRPSPEAENSQCPYWREARLSVRPGITGLWQLYRTREEARDFQEWVHYDTEYVRDLSLRLDLLVYWKTAQKLINNFIDQF
jgi:lipopolysaccharide/colanic/teichoic acid biosynthesis glycosyltransferase/acetyltransferase-like isoleucine patch superfamily enzyme